MGNLENQGDLSGKMAIIIADYKLVGGIPTPLKNDGVRQLG